MAELIMQEEGSTPATPGSGKWKLYPKSSGLYLLDDAGNEIGPLDSSNVLLTTGGTSTAFTITTLPAAALVTGESFRIKFHTTAGATPTLNRDGLGAKSIKYYDAMGTKQAATSTQIITDMILTILYDGTDYVLLNSGISDGWVNFSGTCTYVSANSFTVAGDYTALFKRSLKLRIKQTTNKYFQVVSSSYSAPNTTVVITGGGDYSLANAAITDPYYSNEETPNDFPSTFAWTPTFGGFSVSPTIVTCKFRLYPYGIYVEILANGGTSNANAFTVTAPPGVTLSANATLGIMLITIDNGATITTTPGKLSSNGDSLPKYSITKDFPGAAWTASGTKGARFIGFHLLP